MKQKFTKDEIYDRLVPTFCPPYNQALEYFMERTVQANSVVELGIGTGNIAKAILSNVPSIKYIGFDFSSESLEKCRDKLKGYDFSLNQADFCNILIPKNDFIVSSLSIHHLEHDKQAELFERIHDSCKSFLHFELIAPETKSDGERNNSYLMNHASKVADELGLSMLDIQKMAEESNKHDRPMTIAEHISLHKKCGAQLEILLEDHCFIMYQTRRK